MKNTQFKFYGLLIGILVSILVTCDALSFKVINIFGYDIAVSGILFSFSFPLAAVATEVYGYKFAVRIVWIQLFSQFFFITVVSLIIRLSSQHDIISILYFDLYKQLWRVLIASTIAVPISYFINNFLMSIIKVYYKGNHLIARTLVSNIIGAAILVSISYPINYYGIYSLHHIANIAFNTWLLKLILSIILLPISIILSFVLKKIEKTDFYDYGISYNPVKVFSNNDLGKNEWRQ